MKEMKYLVMMLSCLMGITEVWSAKILVNPYSQGFNSRLMNMEKLTWLLLEDGHDVSMVVNSRYDETMRPISKNVTFFKYDVPDNAVLINDEEVISTMQKASLIEGINLIVNISCSACEDVLASGILQILKAQNFDLFFFDYAEDCARFLVDYLDIPTISYVNEGAGSELIFGTLGHPEPLAIVPSLLVGFPDAMTFLQRVENTVTNIIMHCIAYNTFQHFTTLRTKYGFNTSLSIMDTNSRGVALQFSNNHNVLDWVRPLMPNHIYIGGIYFAPPKSLPINLEAIVEKASTNGIIVASFGSIFKSSFLDRELIEQMAIAFASIPMTVIWKYSGEPPKALGANTHLISWIPQNDLLGHPKVKLFVTHCGCSSTYESIYHALPVVTIPLSVDQYKHSTQLTSRLDMGVEVDFTTLVNTTLIHAINKVIGDPSYRKNAQDASKLIKDNPNNPKDLFLYWVNYVIRNKGAKHLKSKPMQELYLFQYFLLDVFLFLGGILTLVIIIGVASIKFIYRKLMLLCTSKTKRD
ncbi:unnamed protein product [Owenia fusiformis]|uniref:UDP-glucuronosyltransferase n=1 Tax=Owenia fusiformis TaxID=6347 RepID=A0A8J1UKF0_OWEFU|nr:unnamed protein product [Owenia fusiformis]